MLICFLVGTVHLLEMLQFLENCLFWWNNCTLWWRKFSHKFCLWRKMANIKYARYKCSYKSPVHCLKVASLAEVVLVWTAEPQSNNYNGYFSTNGLYLTIQSHSIPWWCFCSCLPHSIPGQKITFLEQFSGLNSAL